MPRSRRDLLLLLGGTAVSVLGSSITLVAVILHLEPSGPGWVAVATGAELVPMLLGAPLAGHLVDRVRNRELLIGSLAVQALAVLLAATVALAPGREAVLGLCLVLLGSASAVARPCVAALLPRISGEQAATRAYGWYSAITQAGFLGGFAVAGLLVGSFGTRNAMLLDAASFVSMAGASALLRTQRDPRAEARAQRPVPAGTHVDASLGLLSLDPGIPADDSRGAPAGGSPGGPARGAVDTGSAWTGFVITWRDQVLRVALFGLTMSILASIVVNVAEVFFLVGDIGVGPTTYGLVTAVWPLAGIAGGWLAGRLNGDRALLLALAGAGALMGLGLLVAGWRVGVGSVVLAWVLGGLANAAQGVCVNALVRSRTRDAERGRVFAASGALFAAANLAGLAGGAALVAAAGARVSMLLAGALTVAVGAVVAALTPLDRRA